MLFSLIINQVSLIRDKIQLHVCELNLFIVLAMHSFQNFPQIHMVQDHSLSSFSRSLNTPCLSLSHQNTLYLKFLAYYHLNNLVKRKKKEENIKRKKIQPPSTLSIKTLNLFV